LFDSLIYEENQLEHNRRQGVKSKIWYLWRAPFL